MFACLHVVAKWDDIKRSAVFPYNPHCVHLQFSVIEFDGETFRVLLTYLGWDSMLL